MKSQPKTRDAEVLAALQASILVRGRMPTSKELCHDIGIKRGQLSRNIARLVSSGALVALPAGTMKVAFPPQGDA